MTDVVERYRSAALLGPHARARVMQPLLDRVPVHWHDFYELGLVLEGSAVHVLNGAPAAIGSGAAFLLSPADLHELRPLGGRPLRCFNVVIDPDDVEALLPRVAADPGAVGFPLVAGDCLDLVPDLERLQRELAAPDPGAAAASAALVTCLLVELVRRGVRAPGAPAVAGPGTAAVREAVRYVERHFREPVTLADAAARAHLSPNYFSERFREVTGSSFQHYLQERRLQFAHALLTSTQLGVSEVCHAAGFRDLSHFGRLYRRRYGRPPSAAKSQV